jgi:hypothetical protein
LVLDLNTNLIFNIRIIFRVFLVFVLVKQIYRWFLFDFILNRKCLFLLIFVVLLLGLLLYLLFGDSFLDLLLVLCASIRSWLLVPLLVSINFLLLFSLLDLSPFHLFPFDFVKLLPVRNFTFFNLLDNYILLFNLEQNAWLLRVHTWCSTEVEL